MLCCPSLLCPFTCLLSSLASGDTLPLVQEDLRGQMTSKDDILVGNHAQTGGTGFVLGAADVSLRNAILRDSIAAGSGGGIFASGAAVQLTLANVQIEDAVAGLDGGCLLVQDGGRLYMQDTTLKNCRAGAQGSSQELGGWIDAPIGLTSISGLYSGGGGGTARSLEISFLSQGGALALRGGIAVFEKQCRLEGNSVNGVGGAIGAIDSQLLARETVFESNSATRGGGGIYSEASFVMLLNGPTFKGNIAGAAPQVGARRKLLQGPQVRAVCLEL